MMERDKYNSEHQPFLDCCSVVSWLFNLKDVIPAEGYAKHTKNTDKCELGEMAVCPKVKVKQVYSVPIISMNPQLPGGGGKSLPSSPSSTTNALLLTQNLCTKALMEILSKSSVPSR